MVRNQGFSHNTLKITEIICMKDGDVFMNSNVVEMLCFEILSHNILTHSKLPFKCLKFSSNLRL